MGQGRHQRLNRRPFFCPASAWYCTVTATPLECLKVFVRSSSSVSLHSCRLARSNVASVAQSCTRLSSSRFWETKTNSSSFPKCPQHRDVFLQSLIDASCQYRSHSSGAKRPNDAKTTKRERAILVGSYTAGMLAPTKRQMPMRVVRNCEGKIGVCLADTITANAYDEIRPKYVVFEFPNGLERYEDKWKEVLPALVECGVSRISQKDFLRRVCLSWHANDHLEPVM